jgi:hypothetical protein
MKAIESGANIDLSTHPEVIQDLMDIAELNYDPNVSTPAGGQATQETQPTQEG